MQKNCKIKTTLNLSVSLEKHFLFRDLRVEALKKKDAFASKSQS
jgi:hypothetical protein